MSLRTIGRPSVDLSGPVRHRPGYRGDVARRRDVRRFGPGPYVLGFRRDAGCCGRGFPYDVPAVAAVEDLALDAPVTLLAGDNGTGKSTLAESFFDIARFVDGG